jgi:hypothetical protein
MEEELLLELEKAYSNGVPFEKIKEAVVAGGMDNQLSIVEDFYKKKKEPGTEQRLSGLGVSPLASTSQATQGSAQTIAPLFISPSEFKSQTWKDVGIDAGFTQSQDKTTWLIADDNPNELQRLWNRAVARGRLGSIMADVETGGVHNIDIEDIAYYNSILQRDAPKDEDWLAANVDEHPIGSFLLDIIRVLPESLISSASAIEAGAVGAASGAGVGALTGGFGAVPGAIGGFFGASSLATEYAGSLMVALQRAGIDVTNEADLMAAFNPQTEEDDKRLSDAKVYALERGVPIGVLDGLAGGMAGKFIKSAALAGTSVSRAMAKEALVQGALGGGGELVGTVLSGDPINVRDIALEAFAELGPAGPGIAYNMVKTRAMTPGEKNYTAWAESQNQRSVSRTTPIAMAVDNGRIARIDSDIRELQNDFKNQSDPIVRKAVKESIAKLKDEKYTALLDVQQQLLGLEGEALGKASELTQEILAAADAVKNGGLSAAEQVAVENQMDLKGKELTDLLNETRKKSDAQNAEQVPGGEQVGEEPGGAQQPKVGTIQAQISEILKARQAEQATAGTRHATSQSKPRASRTISSATSRARKAFNDSRFLNFYDAFDVAIVKEQMDAMTPGQRSVMEKLILASEAYKKLNPEATHFNVGFGNKGYKNAGKNMGVSAKDMSNSSGITSIDRGSRKVGQILAVNFDTNQKESKTGRGYSDRYTPVGTAYHEVMHNVFATYFDKNPVDFNQFRTLIIRRLRESDINELNEFANRYQEREDSKSAGAYKSEEFMVQLGALLGNKRIEFTSSLLEEIKTYLNAIVSKLTGGQVQIFEDAALAKDLAAYLEGISTAIRTGSDIKDVKMSERLQSERFQRAGPDVTMEPDGTVTDVQGSRNLAGLPDPESYEKNKDTLEKMMAIINPKLSALGEKIEKTFGLSRVREYNAKILQALEVSSSMNVQHMNRMFLALQRIRNSMKSLTEDQKQRAYDLTNQYWFGETKQEQDAAIIELQKIYPDVANDVSILSAIRDFLQDTMANSPAFDTLSDSLRLVIKENATRYGTRTYRLFTDTSFKIDPELRNQAEKVLVEGYIWEEANKLHEEGLTDKQEQEFLDNGLNPDEFDSYLTYIYSNKDLIFKITKRVQDKLRTLEDLSAAKKGTSGGLTGDPKLGQLRVPTKQFREKKDLPIELRKMMGEETDPFVKFSHTVSTLANITSQYTLVDRINEIAQLSGMNNLIITKPFWKGLNDNTLSMAQLQDIGKQMGVIPPNSSINEWMKEGGMKDKSQATLALRDYFNETYTVIEEDKSPMKGKAVRNDFVSMLKLTPMYESDGRPLLQLYYNLLLQMRRVRVLANLPTWRKNIMGGWYFLMANGVLPYNEDRGGFTLIEDLRNRFNKIKNGELDPEMEAVIDHVGSLGLLGASPNLGVLGDMNQSFYDMMLGMDPNDAWAWLPKSIQTAQRKFNVAQSRVAYNYGFIDDYTKIIMYLDKRESFAKRLASNPDGKKYSELSPAQKQEVDLAVVERIKQNTPTMSRIHPAFRVLFKLPMGDFLSFRVESFRSFYSIYKNASSDIREALTNGNLSESQKKAYMLDGVKSIAMGIGMASMSTAGYAALASMLLDDDEEKELASEVRGLNYLLPAWMVGSNILPLDMDKSGKIRFINISSEDPYDEMQGLIYGREGISKSDALSSIAKDFTNPNLAMGMLFNLLQGRNSYGQPIVSNEDASWFNRWIIGSTLTDWSDAYGAYVFKETFLPPNVNYIAREWRKRVKEAEVNPDIELQPLETAAELSTAVVFRDYPVDISKQFYYNMEEQNFRTPYVDLKDGEKVNRQARLDEIRAAYKFSAAYSSKFNNFKIVGDVLQTIQRKFRKSPAEIMYILYNVELPD